MKISNKPRRPKTRTPAWHIDFLRMLPVIQESTSFSFRYLPPEARQEAIQDVTVGALAAFVRLVDIGKTHLAYATVLARYGIAQFRCGRRVGSRLNVRDISSPYAQRKKNFVVERLDHVCVISPLTSMKFCWIRKGPCLIVARIARPVFRLELVKSSQVDLNLLEAKR